MHCKSNRDQKRSLGCKNFQLGCKKKKRSFDAAPQCFYYIKCRNVIGFHRLLYDFINTIVVRFLKDHINDKEYYHLANAKLVKDKRQKSVIRIYILHICIILMGKNIRSNYIFLLFCPFYTFYVKKRGAFFVRLYEYFI